MKPIFEIDNYGELIALWNAAMLAKFSPDMPKPEIYASTTLASAMEKMRETLIQIEEVSGKKNVRENWNWAKLELDSVIWWRIVTNIAKSSPDWKRLSDEIKVEMIEAAVVPHGYDKQIVEKLTNDILIYVEDAKEILEFDSPIWMRVVSNTSSTYTRWQQFPQDTKQSMAEATLKSFRVNQEMIERFINDVTEVFK